MKRRLFVWGVAGLLLLLLSVVVSLSLGSAHIPVAQVWGVLLKQIPYIGSSVPVTWPESSEQIIMKVRLPRIVLGILIGAALSVAGAGFQGVLRNPLADPYTLGVASGASVGAAFLISFGLHYALFGMWSIPIVAFATGLATLWVVFRLAGVQGRFRTETVILSGVVVSSFLSAIVSFMVALNSDKIVNEILFWLMGSLALRGWPYTTVILPYLLIGAVVLIAFARSLNLFALGERHAAHLGVRVERTKWIVLLVSTVLTSAAVSVCGVIGFVGLITPHLVRLMVGPDYRLLIPLSLLFGGIYVLWADTLARMVLSPTEIPLGVVTAFLGAPFFAYLLSRQKKLLKG
ncbi:iron ABC transporter permease [Paenibacillus hemerocallicola]|jgi:iron complex transport system permease protein|uniref:Iron ABC transporter permease n=1 Tax=Paenibacillus hemerocallicola TaxID=1172614 RepID=A0A5C4T275_9BACL|nr:iron ABC transporter permease [Paenibacillus hemerocallicola]TNJ63151.1 iron ABC transporter permease [Paenibacillus hemerocallicola]